MLNIWCLFSSVSDVSEWVSLLHWGNINESILVYVDGLWIWRWTFFSFYLLHCSPAGGDIVNSMVDQWNRILPNQGIIRHLASSGVYWIHFIDYLAIFWRLKCGEDKDPFFNVKHMNCHIKVYLDFFQFNSFRVYKSSQSFLEILATK